jgi:hypothetical protein
MTFAGDPLTQSLSPFTFLKIGDCPWTFHVMSNAIDRSQVRRGDRAVPREQRGGGRVALVHREKYLRAQARVSAVRARETEVGGHMGRRPAGA